MERISYTKKELLSKLSRVEDLKLLYKSKIINYTGKTKDTKEKYTEVLSEELLNNKNYDFNNKIKQINRTYSYFQQREVKINKKSNRREEIIAKKMFDNKYDELGKMIGYQVPIKSASSKTNEENKGVGKVDLISYNEKEKILYLIELKNDFSNETLLRCVLEIITYYNQINKEKLKEDFNLNNVKEVKPAILIFEETRPFDDINDKYVNELIKKYNINIFTATSKEHFYIKEKQHE